MYISVVTLHVDDVDRAIEFYTSKLGWKKTMDVPMGEGRWVTVAPPGATTAFTLSTDFPKASPDAWGGFSGIIMETENVYVTGDQFTKAGVDIVEPPRTEPWGGWASFKDSEGNIHGLHSPVPAAVSKN
jgi:predicted enzyme related to lactoylglutathione lyase